MYVLRWRQRDCHGQIHTVKCVAQTELQARLIVDAVWEDRYQNDIACFGEPIWVKLDSDLIVEQATIRAFAKKKEEG